MKRFLFIGIGLIVLVSAGLLIAPQFVNWNSYKSQIVDGIKNTTGYDVLFNGDLGFALLPSPYLYLEDVTFSSSEASAPFAKFEQLDVHLKPLPLLQGSLVFGSVRFIRPEFVLEKDTEDQFTFMTEEIQAILNKPQSQQTQNDAGWARNVSVSFEKIYIEDGQVRYQVGGNDPIVFSKIHSALSAQSFNGPFIADGTFAQAGQNFAFKFTTNQMDEAKALPIKMNIRSEDLKASLDYAGILSFSDALEVQGEVQWEGKSLTAQLQSVYGMSLPLWIDQYRLKGLLTVSPENVALTNANLTFGEDAQFQIGARANLKDTGFQLDIDAPSLIRIDPFLKGSQSTSSEFDPARIDPFLPSVKISLENQFLKNASARIFIKQLSYKGKLFSDIRLKVNAKDNIGYEFSVADAPGKSQISSSGTLLYQGDSNPYLDLTAKGGSQNFEELLGLFLDLSNPVFSEFKTGSFDFKGVWGAERIRFNPFQLRLNDTQLLVAGSIDRGETFKRAKLDLNIDAKGIKPSQFVDGDLPAGFESLDTKVTFRGGIQDFQAAANANIRGTQIIAQADIRDILNTMSVSNAVLQVKAQNANNFFNNFAPAIPRYQSMNGPLDFYTKLDWADKNVSLNEIQGKIASSSVTGGVNIEFAELLTLRGKLDFSKLILQDSAAERSPSPQTRQERWSSAPIDFSGLKNIEADIAIRADQFLYENWDIQGFSSQIALSKGAFEVNNIAGKMFDGTINGNLSVVTGAQKNAEIASDISIQKVEIEEFARAFAGSSLLQSTGQMDFNAQLKTNGQSVQDFVRRLSGQGTLKGNDIVIEGIDLPQLAGALSDDIKPSDTVSGLLRGATSGGSTVFSSMDGVYAVNEGIVQVQKLSLVGSEANIDTTGKIHLPNWSIDTAHTVSFAADKDIPEFTINIKGPLDNPAKTFGQGLLEDFLKRKIERKIQKTIQDKVGNKLQEKLGDKLGIPLGFPSQQEPQNEQSPQAPQKNSTPPPPPQETSPEDAFRGVLDGILSR